MAKNWKCSTCERTFNTESGCQKHIEQTHTRSGKGGQPIKVHESESDYSDAAFQLGPHVYGH